ncbi:MAG: hypothetical protein SFV55_27065 [Haliscomenobacter sp.]|uniref:hypothetical protein n=1 Tax=Haliscomenobacter sp. TaxID=2717303 RepID=UPI0029B49B7D|nr:hypothetical protein [Haliscomenobacter sp.]MDX2072125.1 hypothetical protein [Haliscomenobacter sp.]
MEQLLKKLNYKDQSPILLLNLPAELSDFAHYIQSVTELVDSLDKVEKPQFALFFVTQLSEIEAIAHSLQGRLEADPIIWFVYPKGTSKRYKCNFNRDTGWAALGKLGLESVRMVAVNEDWSALRFRRVEYIKVLTRKFETLSEEGNRKMRDER